MSSRNIVRDIQDGKADDALLRAYRDRVEQELFDALLSDIEPKMRAKIREAAKAAADSLDLAVKAYVDKLRDETFIGVRLRIESADEKGAL